MTWLIWLIIGFSITYYIHYKTMDLPRSERRQTPIINTGIQQLDTFIFIGGYVIVSLTIYIFSGENPYYFLENNPWAGGLSLPLQYGWWIMFLEGRKEMNEREEDIKRREEWKKNNPEEWLKLNNPEEWEKRDPDNAEKIQKVVDDNPSIYVNENYNYLLEDGYIDRTDEEIDCLKKNDPDSAEQIQKEFDEEREFIKRHPGLDKKLQKKLEDFHAKMEDLDEDDEDLPF